MIQNNDTEMIQKWYGRAREKWNG